MTKITMAFLLTVGVAMASGCASAPGSTPLLAPDTLLTTDCVNMLDVVFACTMPGYETTEADRTKCHDTAVANAAIPGCVDLSQDEILCVEGFFSSYNSCEDASVSQIDSALQAYALEHCPSVVSQAQTLNCHDWL